MSGKISPKEIAQYFVNEAFEYGDFISNLKLQKLVYYTYSWFYTVKNIKLFTEPFEAWVNGPVLKSLYNELKEYKNMPIEDEWLDDFNKEEFISKIDEINGKELLNKVTVTYLPLSAFELVMLSHSETPWVKARKGLPADANCSEHILDKDIKMEYSNQSF